MEGPKELDKIQSEWTPFPILHSKHLIFELVLQQFRPEEILPLRLVCKDWNETVGQNAAIDKLFFRVGNDPDSIKAFTNLSPSFKLKNFTFENLDLEEKFFKNPIIFRRFALNHCPTIVKLTLRKCKLNLGRFIELLAFCKKLKDLAIRLCPSLYQVDLGILQWGFCFKYVQRNLAGLTILKLAEWTIQEDDLRNFTRNMKSLRTINLAHLNLNDVNGKPLPCSAVMDLLKSNCETLCSLTLAGKLLGQNVSSSDYALLNDFPKMKALTSIRFLKESFGTISQSIFLQSFLKVCPKLRELRIAKATIHKETLEDLQGSLTDLYLEGCCFVDGTFQNASWTRLKKLTITQPGKPYDVAQDAIVRLLHSNLPMLESLELNQETGGSAILQKMVPARLPKLNSLSMTGFIDINEGPLRKLFKTFPRMKSLSIVNCENLADEHFCKTKKYDCVKKTLGNFSDMEDLNLSGTKIGNQTVVECVLLMQKLKSLRLERTEVDGVGLTTIMSAVARELIPGLCYVNLQGSSCLLSKDELTKLTLIAPHVNVTCSSYA